MTPDIVAVGILEDAPGFKPPVYRLVSRSNMRLHPLVGDRVARVIRALDLVGGAHLAVVGLDALARVEEVPEDLIKYLDVRPFPSRVRTLDPHQIPAQNANPDLVS